MELKQRLKDIFSVSAASLALLQSTSASKAKELEAIAGDFSQRLQTQETSSFDKVVLTPGVSQDELLQRYAAHRSHSSHRSHASHASHYSSYGRTTPPPTVPPPPAAPVTPQTPAEPIVQSPANAPVRNVTRNKETLARLVSWEKQRAAEGSPTSQYDLGVRYLNGNGVEKDEQLARMYLEMAARQQYAPALEKVRQLSLTPSREQAPANGPLDKLGGFPVKTNPAPTISRPQLPKKEPAALVKEAAAGSAVAQYELGVRYLTGDGVERDVQKAKTFLELSSAQGNMLATEQLRKINISEPRTP